MCTSATAVKVQFRDWDDCALKTHYVNKDAFELSVGQAAGITFREYGMNTKQEALIGGMNDGALEDDIKVLKINKVIEGTYDGQYSNTLFGGKSGKDFAVAIADEYGADVADITTDKYSLLFYYDVLVIKNFLMPTVFSVL